jgi:N-acetylmuramoyl-L-alanine amidase
MLKIGWSKRDVSTDKPVNLPGQFHRRPSRGVLDPITINCLVVEGEDIVIFISGDFVSGGNMIDVFREKVLSRRPDFPASKMIFNITHTHCGADIRSKKDIDDPNIYSATKYQEYMSDLTVDAILEALTSISEDSLITDAPKTTEKIKIALLPGHSSADGGAEMVSGLKLSEYDFAMKFIPEVKHHLEQMGYEVVVTRREDAGGTTPSYSAKAANATNADASFEFHFNSAGSQATGSEYLYEACSSKYRKAASIMCTTWSKLTGIRDRGAVAVCTVEEQTKYKRSTSRGLNAFKKANMFFCMTEPFFASNPKECEYVTELYKSGQWSKYMATAISNACISLFN